MENFSLDRDNWMHILNQINQETGKIADDKIIGVKKDAIDKLFSSIKELEKEGYQPVTTDWFVSKSIKLITNNDVTERKKMNAYIRQQIIEKSTEEIIEPFKKIASSYQNLDPEILESEARSAFHHYKLSNIPEFLMLSHRLFDLAVDRYSEHGKYQEGLELRQHQLKKITPEIKLTSSLMDKSKWESPSGLYVDKRDGGSLKQSTIHIQKFPDQDDQKKHVRLNLKVSYPEREQLQRRLDSLSRIKKDQLSGIFKNGVEVKTNQDFFYPTISKTKPVKLGKVTEVDFKGTGKLLIGESERIGSLYNYVTVVVSGDGDAKKNLEDIHQMLTFLGLGSCLHPNTLEDEERKKIMLIFRTFFPRECFDFENEAQTFIMPPKELLDSIKVKVPDSAKVFSKYLKDKAYLIETESLYEGKEVYSLSDLSSMMKEEGAAALFRGMEATKKNNGEIDNEATAETIVSNLQNGRLSVQDRNERGLPVGGSSPLQDHGSNAADVVFNRLITVNLLKKGEKKIADFPLCGDWQMIINLDALNRGFYSYKSDKYGQKNRKNLYEISSFKERMNPIEFTRSMQEEYIDENELMIKNSIHPRYIQGIVVGNDDLKKTVISNMRNKKMLEDINGNLYYNGKDINKFIHVSKTFKSGMF